MKKVISGQQRKKEALMKVMREENKKREIMKSVRGKNS